MELLTEKEFISFMMLFFEINDVDIFINNEIRNIIFKNKYTSINAELIIQLSWDDFDDHDHDTNIPWCYLKVNNCDSIYFYITKNTIQLILDSLLELINVDKEVCDFDCYKFLEKTQEKHDKFIYGV